nr:MAG TPA: hypothetical protein [Caudoviricetes sp.]DAU53374.1 MAG TPA: hypothetical protein [Caudoviricetes sp.]
MLLPKGQPPLFPPTAKNPRKTCQKPPWRAVE